MLSIGRRSVISLPNYERWRVRASLLFKGRMPRTRTLDYSWHDSPNIHLCTRTDIIALAHEEVAVIERAQALREDARTQEMNPGSWGPNILAQGAIFLLRGP